MSRNITSTGVGPCSFNLSIISMINSLRGVMNCEGRYEWGCLYINIVLISKCTIGALSYIQLTVGTTHQWGIISNRTVYIVLYITVLCVGRVSPGHTTEFRIQDTFLIIIILVYTSITRSLD